MTNKTVLIGLCGTPSAPNRKFDATPARLLTRKPIETCQKTLFFVGGFGKDAITGRVNSAGDSAMKMRHVFALCLFSASPVFADDVPLPDVLAALQQLHEAQQIHLDVLTKLLDRVPEQAKPAIQNAIESSQKGLEQSRDALAKAHGKPKEHGKPDGVGGKPEHAGPPVGRGHGKPDGVGHGKPDGVGGLPKGLGKPDGVGGGKPANVGKGKQRGGPNR